MVNDAWRLTDGGLRCRLIKVDGLMRADIIISFFGACDAGSMRAGGGNLIVTVKTLLNA